MEEHSYHNLCHLRNSGLFENYSVNYAQSSTHLSSSWGNMLNYRHTHTHETLSSFPELLFLYLICVLLNMVIIMKGLSCTWFNLFLCLFSALLLSPSGVCVCACALVRERDTACVLMSVCVFVYETVVPALTHCVTVGPL